MKLSLLVMMSLPIAMYAQDSISVNSTEYPNTYSSGSANVQKFDNSARRFNDWAISVGGGAAFMAKADLTSFYDKKVNWGWNGFVSLDKQITHTFGLSLLYTKGETKQKAYLNDAAGVGHGYTKFDQVALLGDVNFSNLMRRVDNHSKFRWTLHGYAGIGLTGYKTFLQDNNLLSKWPLYIEQKMNVGSFTYIGGAG